MADVEFRNENGVLWITLNRPEQMGALTSEMRDQIVDQIWAARDDTAVRALVITGKGKGFCTGADLSGGAPPTPWVGRTRFMMRTGSQAHIAFVSDLIVAAEGARFIEVFSRRGIALDAMGGFILPRILPLAKAKELVFFGDQITAEEAKDLGVVNKVVPVDDLESTTREWAERLAVGPTFAIGISKRLLNRGTEVDLETSLDDEATMQALVVGSEDAQEGINSFRERRKPAFKGN
jgi:2-(1,2-epoxy-1,2-dihydrophenyl)acetyl-CoA isomerase